MSVGACKTCVYFDKKAQECHRYPPTPFPVPRASSITGEAQVSVLGLFPAARADWYCGEHRTEDA